MDGLYHQKYPYPPETMLSHSFFLEHTEEFYRFYRDKLIVKDVKPNRTHLRLAELERAGKLRAVITQNIDGLHQAAGSRNVLELHGSTLRNRCMKCGREYGLSFVAGSAGVPRCTCGGIVKPEVVLYEEVLDQDLMQRAADYIARADVLIIGGTSLVVYPAAGLVRLYRGKKLALINKGATAYDSAADLLLQMPLGEVFSRV